MPREFVVPNINNLTSSYGVGGNLPQILNIPGPLSIKKNIPYTITVETNK